MNVLFQALLAGLDTFFKVSFKKWPVMVMNLVVIIAVFGIDVFSVHWGEMWLLVISPSIYEMVLAILSVFKRKKKDGVTQITVAITKE